ncbi:MAG: hypothetical protein SXV54_13835 [Chloroflexota bacterium]|nr:hypothetical protein [Chloroflexota bacterium]
MSAAEPRAKDAGSTLRWQWARSASTIRFRRSRPGVIRVLLKRRATVVRRHTGGLLPASQIGVLPTQTIDGAPLRQRQRRHGDGNCLPRSKASRRQRSQSGSNAKRNGSNVGEKRDGRG